MTRSRLAIGREKSTKSQHIDGRIVAACIRRRRIDDDVTVLVNRNVCIDGTSHEKENV